MVRNCKKRAKNQFALRVVSVFIFLGRQTSLGVGSCGMAKAM